jgi:hypothetical protein
MIISCPNIQGAISTPEAANLLVLMILLERGFRASFCIVYPIRPWLSHSQRRNDISRKDEFTISEHSRNIVGLTISRACNVRFHAENLS